MYQERFRLDGETAVITGGGRGIGLACAEALGEVGARVVLIELEEASAKEECAPLPQRALMRMASRVT
jgi:NAD(P)-dependent dehydrogenase (short-subunit alcohol dehydrogenase family)